MCTPSSPNGGRVLPSSPDGGGGSSVPHPVPMAGGGVPPSSPELVRVPPHQGLDGGTPRTGHGLGTGVPPGTDLEPVNGSIVRWRSGHHVNRHTPVKTETSPNSLWSEGGQQFIARGGPTRPPYPWTESHIYQETLLR